MSVLEVIIGIACGVVDAVDELIKPILLGVGEWSWDLVAT